MCIAAPKASQETFLTPAQARDAIAADFQQYGPQPALLRRIAPLILGPDFRLQTGECRIRPSRTSPFQPVDDDALAFFLLHVLEQKEIPLGILARICTQVFETPARTGCPEKEPGIWIQDQMQGFVCHQCGDCCTRLESLCTPKDWQRWHSLGRKDILAWVRPEPMGHGQVRYRIWIDPRTGTPARTCPFLAETPGSHTRTCRIQAVKPEVCREYPFTRKHAAMTGCKGLFACQ